MHGSAEVLKERFDIFENNSTLQSTPLHWMAGAAHPTSVTDTDSRSRCCPMRIRQMPPPSDTLKRLSNNQQHNKKKHMQTSGRRRHRLLAAAPSLAHCLYLTLCICLTLVLTTVIFPRSVHADLFTDAEYTYRIDPLTTNPLPSGLTWVLSNVTYFDDKHFEIVPVPSNWIEVSDAGAVGGFPYWFDSFGYVSINPNGAIYLPTPIPLIVCSPGSCNLDINLKGLIAGSLTDLNPSALLPLDASASKGGVFVAWTSESLFIRWDRVPMYTIPGVTPSFPPFTFSIELRRSGRIRIRWEQVHDPTPDPFWNGWNLTRTWLVGLRQGQNIWMYPQNPYLYPESLQDLNMLDWNTTRSHASYLPRSRIRANTMATWWPFGSIACNTPSFGDGVEVAHTNIFLKGIRLRDPDGTERTEEGAYSLDPTRFQFLCVFNGGVDETTFPSTNATYNATIGALRCNIPRPSPIPAGSTLEISLASRDDPATLLPLSKMYFTYVDPSDDAYQSWSRLSAEPFVARSNVVVDASRRDLRMCYECARMIPHLCPSPSALSTSTSLPKVGPDGTTLDPEKIQFRPMCASPSSIDFDAANSTSAGGSGEDGGEPVVLLTPTLDWRSMIDQGVVDPEAMWCVWTVARNTSSTNGSSGSNSSDASNQQQPAAEYRSNPSGIHPFLFANSSVWNRATLFTNSSILSWIVCHTPNTTQLNYSIGSELVVSVAIHNFVVGGGAGPVGFGLGTVPWGFNSSLPIPSNPSPLQLQASSGTAGGRMPSKGRLDANGLIAHIRIVNGSVDPNWKRYQNARYLRDFLLAPRPSSSTAATSSSSSSSTNMWTDLVPSLRGLNVRQLCSDCAASLHDSSATASPSTPIKLFYPPLDEVCFDPHTPLMSKPSSSSSGSSSASNTTFIVTTPAAELCLSPHFGSALANYSGTHSEDAPGTLNGTSGSLLLSDSNATSFVFFDFYPINTRRNLFDLWCEWTPLLQANVSQLVNTSIPHLEERCVDTPSQPLNLTHCSNVTDRINVTIYTYEMRTVYHFELKTIRDEELEELQLPSAEDSAITPPTAVQMLYPRGGDDGGAFGVFSSSTDARARRPKLFSCSIPAFEAVQSKWNWTHLQQHHASTSVSNATGNDVTTVTFVSDRFVRLRIVENNRAIDLGGGGSGRNESILDGVEIRPASFAFFEYVPESHPKLESYLSSRRKVPPAAPWSECFTCDRSMHAPSSRLPFGRSPAAPDPTSLEEATRVLHVDEGYCFESVSSSSLANAPLCLAPDVASMDPASKVLPNSFDLGLQSSDDSAASLSIVPLSNSSIQIFSHASYPIATRAALTTLYCVWTLPPRYNVSIDPATNQTVSTALEPEQPAVYLPVRSWSLEAHFIVCAVPSFGQWFSTEYTNLTLHLSEYDIDLPFKPITVLYESLTAINGSLALFQELQEEIFARTLGQYGGDSTTNISAINEAHLRDTLFSPQMFCTACHEMEVVGPMFMPPLTSPNSSSSSSSSSTATAGGTDQCFVDCGGRWNGFARLDDCGQCFGGFAAPASGRTRNQDLDCFGVCFGPFRIASTTLTNSSGQSVTYDRCQCEGRAECFYNASAWIESTTRTSSTDSVSSAATWRMHLPLVGRSLPSGETSRPGFPKSFPRAGVHSMQFVRRSFVDELHAGSEVSKYPDVTFFDEVDDVTSFGTNSSSSSAPSNPALSDLSNTQYNLTLTPDPPFDHPLFKSLNSSAWFVRPEAGSTPPDGSAKYFDPQIIEFGFNFPFYNSSYQVGWISSSGGIFFADPYARFLAECFDRSKSDMSSNVRGWPLPSILESSTTDREETYPPGCLIPSIWTYMTYLDPTGKDLNDTSAWSPSPEEDASATGGVFNASQYADNMIALYEHMATVAPARVAILRSVDLDTDSSSSGSTSTSSTSTPSTSPSWLPSIGKWVSIKFENVPFEREAFDPTGTLVPDPTSSSGNHVPLYSFQVTLYETGRVSVRFINVTDPTNNVYRDADGSAFNTTSGKAAALVVGLVDGVMPESVLTQGSPSNQFLNQWPIERNISSDETLSTPAYEVQGALAIALQKQWMHSSIRPVGVFPPRVITRSNTQHVFCPLALNACMYPPVGPEAGGTIVSFSLWNLGQDAGCLPTPDRLGVLRLKCLFGTDHPPTAAWYDAESHTLQCRTPPGTSLSTVPVQLMEGNSSLITINKLFFSYFPWGDPRLNVYDDASTTNSSLIRHITGDSDPDPSLAATAWDMHLSLCRRCSTFNPTWCPLDCAGEVFGGAFIDDCGQCTGGLTKRLPNGDKDCAGVCGGMSRWMTFNETVNGSGGTNSSNITICACTNPAAASCQAALFPPVRPTPSQIQHKQYIYHRYSNGTDWQASMESLLDSSGAVEIEDDIPWQTVPTSGTSYPAPLPAAPIALKMPLALPFFERQLREVSLSAFGGLIMEQAAFIDEECVQDGLREMFVSNGSTTCPYHLIAVSVSHWNLSYPSSRVSYWFDSPPNAGSTSSSSSTPSRLTVVWSDMSVVGAEIDEGSGEPFLHSFALRMDTSGRITMAYRRARDPNPLARENYASTSTTPSSSEQDNSELTTLVQPAGPEYAQTDPFWAVGVFEHWYTDIDVYGGGISDAGSKTVTLRREVVMPFPYELGPNSTSLEVQRTFLPQTQTKQPLGTFPMRTEINSGVRYEYCRISDDFCLSQTFGPVEGGTLLRFFADDWGCMVHPSTSSSSASSSSSSSAVSCCVARLSLYCVFGEHVRARAWFNYTSLSIECRSPPSPEGRVDVSAQVWLEEASPALPNVIPAQAEQIQDGTSSPLVVYRRIGSRSNFRFHWSTTRAQLETQGLWNVYNTDAAACRSCNATLDVARASIVSIGGATLSSSETFFCAVDCNGDLHGNAALDGCGVCSGGRTGHVFNSDLDCRGTCFGPFRWFHPRTEEEKQLVRESTGDDSGTVQSVCLCNAFTNTGGLPSCKYYPVEDGRVKESTAMKVGPYLWTLFSLSIGSGVSAITFYCATCIKSGQMGAWRRRRRRRARRGVVAPGGGGDGEAGAGAEAEADAAAEAAEQDGGEIELAPMEQDGNVDGGANDPVADGNAPADNDDGAVASAPSVPPRIRQRHDVGGGSGGGDSMLDASGMLGVAASIEIQQHRRGGGGSRRVRDRQDSSSSPAHATSSSQQQPRSRRRGQHASSRAAAASMPGLSGAAAAVLGEDESDSSSSSSRSSSQSSHQARAPHSNSRSARRYAATSHHQHATSSSNSNSRPRGAAAAAGGSGSRVDGQPVRIHIAEAREAQS